MSYVGDRRVCGWFGYEDDGPLSRGTAPRTLTAPTHLNLRPAPGHSALWRLGARTRADPPLCAAARLSLGGLACVQIRMFGARSKADWIVKHLPVDHDLVSELRFSGLDPVRRL
jgi:hypothetical protein